MKFIIQNYFSISRFFFFLHLSRYDATFIRAHLIHFIFIFIFIIIIILLFALPLLWFRSNGNGEEVTMVPGKRKRSDDDDASLTVEVTAVRHCFIILKFMKWYLNGFVCWWYVESNKRNVLAHVYEMYF